MFSPALVIVVICLYVGFLFLIAFFVERKSLRGRNLADNPLVYSLAIAVHLTAWTFYGSVGSVVTSGMLFLSWYIGPTLSFIFAWAYLRKAIRIKNKYRITSIADFISLRYNKSFRIAALVTIIAVVGITPYIALQLKSVISTFDVITKYSRVSESSFIGHNIGIIVTGLMILFTIVFGIRRLDPTERHPGIMVVLAVESLVKLAAFLAVGVFITYFMFDGFGAIFQQITKDEILMQQFGKTDSSYLPQWISNIILSMSAIFFLPRQFHVTVVENCKEDHIKTAMWIFPLYMLLISVFMVPIAIAGLIRGYPGFLADTFTIKLPFDYGYKWLSMFVFIGGFSAATAMIIVAAMTISTMVTNHLVLPLIERIRYVGFLRRYLLRCRWAVATIFILSGYWFERHMGASYMLANMGLLSFTAVLQFTPAMIGGLIWKKANKTGAISGLSSGFLIWAYTMLAPAFAKSGWISPAYLEQGPWGISWLKPEHLFGVTGLDPASHAVLWTALFNIGFYVLGSLYFEQTQEERNISDEFVMGLTGEAAPARVVSSQAVIDVAEKKIKIQELFSLYFPRTHAVEVTRRCLSALKIDNKNTITIVELAKLNSEVEKALASSIGAAPAHYAMQKAAFFYTPWEEKELREAYAGIIAELKLSPSDLLNKIDYYREREKLLTDQAIEMEEKVKERDNEIAERKRIEEALAAEKERLAVTLRSIGDGVITTDTNGRVSMINKIAEDMTGWKQQESLGRPLSEVFHIINEKTRQVCESPVDRVIKTGGIIELANHTVLISKDGTERIIADSGAPIRDRESKIIGIVLVFRDITEKKRLEEELWKSQKLESLGILAGGIAHDFNNILTAIIGNISLINVYAEPGDKISGLLEKVEKASLRAKDLTQQLLTFSRGGAPIRKITSLAEVIRDSANFALRGAKIRCEFSIPEDLWPTEVDEGQISQVIHNISINAVQAMHEGGILKVYAENIDAAKVHNLPITPGRYIRISIKDTGIGLPREYLDRIFDPYFTTKHQGSGLGLTTSYSIIKKHDGHITVESEVGVGTTFHIYLPASGKELVRVEHGVKPIYSGKGRVLVMDDEDLVRTVAGDMLRHLGYEVEFAEDGREVIELYTAAKDLFKPYDAVIMDLTVPGGMGGKETIRKLLEVDPEVRAVVSSGYSTDPIMADFRAYGFCCVVTKPYTIETLSRAMQEVIKR